MFCYKCGKQLPDFAVFCSKCGTKQTDYVQPTQNTTTDIPNNTANSQRKKQLTIEAVENALLKDHKVEDRITLLKVAGDAYATGDIGAPKDAQKAIANYREAADLGSIECKHQMGVIYINTYCEEPGEDAEFNFSLGVMYVCESYKQGYVPAGDTLQYLLDNKVFPNCHSIKDILDLSTVN